MAAIKAYHDEAKRIWQDVMAVCVQWRKLTADGDPTSYDSALRKAFGSANGRDLKSEAIRETADADVRQRIEAVDKALTYFVNASYSGTVDVRISCELRDRLRSLEPFAGESAIAEQADPEPKPKAGSRKKRRGNSADKTTKVDMACDFIRDNPEQADITPTSLATMLNCSKSLLSSASAKTKLQKAREIAKRNVRGVRRGFSTDDHQADSKCETDWDSINSRIDSSP